MQIDTPPARGETPAPAFAPTRDCDYICARSFCRVRSIKVRIMSRRSSRLALLGVLALVAACNRPPVPGLARGEALYTTCAKCHGDAGTGNQALGAPAIGGLPAWYVQAQIANFKAG